MVRGGSSIGPLVRGFRDPKLAVLLGWVAVLLATQAWLTIDEGVRVEFATDAGVYRGMAEAAPGLPEGPIREQHAERWVVHWLVGSLADATGLELETTYRVVGLTVLAGFTLLLQLVLLQLRLSAPLHAACLGLVLASAYPFRYWLAAPGMIADAVFGLGLVLALLGLVRSRLAVVVLGLAVATVGRQTAVPAALALAVVVALPRTSFVFGRAARLGGAATVALVPLAIYAVVKAVAHGFSVADLPPLDELTILADGPRQLVSHVGRLGLGLAFPLFALVACAGLWAREAIGPLVLGAAIVAQPLVLTSSWIDFNEPRLAGLAAPALAVAAAVLLEQVRVGAGVATVVCAALFLGSLHHLYSNVGLGRPLWVAFVALAALATAGGLALARRSQPGRS